MNDEKKIIGSNLIILDEVDSTNAYLNSLIENSSDIEEGVVVTASSQTKGKGLGRNVWESEAGKNIAMSFYIKPEIIPASENYSICRFVSLAVYDFVLEYLKSEVSIKWPNDIYYKQGKLAGILIENNISGSFIKYCLVGIGVNINQVKFLGDAPNPVSFGGISGKLYDVQACLNTLCLCLNNRYQQLLNGGAEMQKQEYLCRLHGLGEWMNFRSGTLTFKGKILGVADYGKLIVENAEGIIQEYEQKEIQFILPKN